MQCKMGAMTAVLDDSQKAVPRLAGAEDFEPWMRSEQRRIFTICLRLLNDRDECDSAVQDVFLKAYYALDRQDEANAATLVRDPAKWLTRIAVNTCLDRLRSRRLQFWRKRTGAEAESAILSLTASKAPEGEQKAFATEIDRRIRAAMQSLSIRQKAVFTLKHYSDHSLDEIAEILDLDLATVKTHMARALEKLRGELKDLYGRQAF